MSLILPTHWQLLEVASQVIARAEFVPLTRDLAKYQIDRDWWNIDGRVIRRTDGDTWQWTRIVGQSRTNAWSEALALQTADDAIQGAIQYRTDGKSLLQANLGSVFVEHIATAPRNRPWVKNPPVFRGAGTGLLLYAVCHSYVLGLGGRVTLVSLPTERTRDFYKNRGFATIDEFPDGTVEFELPENQAQSWLKEEGLL